MSLIDIRDKYFNLKNEIESLLDKEIEPILTSFKNDFLIPISKDEDNFVDSFYRHFSDESETTEDFINDLIDELRFVLKKIIKKKRYESFDYKMDIEISYLDSSFLSVFVRDPYVLHKVIYRPNRDVKNSVIVSKDKECIFEVNVEKNNVCKDKKVTLSI